ncbi:hypothetical protein SAMN05720606_106233 [Paenibacillus polysaccharolyticus]|uniref:Uncharacterized protein n=1 Tax=Paenibacillus polysaccharolyticus TaxID=582692 RepID=A0A1G5H5L8_9BACL|nr:hypothetical protein SAMN05720606_106233 [Paenibacillus polysaccharolyticus]
MKSKKIMAILLFSVMILSTFPISQNNVQNQIYVPSAHGIGQI